MTYQTARKIHLWVGLILAIILTIEAVTGLILAEPWLVGKGKPQIHMNDSQPTIEQRESIPRAITANGKPAQGGFNTFRFVHDLHQGKVGEFDVTWIIDLSAIGLIILVITGVYLSIPFLRIRSTKKLSLRK